MQHKIAKWHIPIPNAMITFLQTSLHNLTTCHSDSCITEFSARIFFHTIHYCTTVITHKRSQTIQHEVRNINHLTKSQSTTKILPKFQNNQLPRRTKTQNKICCTYDAILVHLKYKSFWFASSPICRPKRVIFPRFTRHKTLLQSKSTITKYKKSLSIQSRITHNHT